MGREMAKEYREGRSGAGSGKSRDGKGTQKRTERELQPRAQRGAEKGAGSRSQGGAGKSFAPKNHAEVRRGTALKDQREVGRGTAPKDQRGARRDTSSRTRQEAGPREGRHKLCPVSARCGGCKWINIGYQEQLEAKADRFRRLMEPFCRPEPLIPMEKPAHYRNKVHAAFGEDRRHNAVSGIYEERSHRIVPVDSCLIENQKADEIIVSIRGLLKSFKIRPYNEDTGYGLLRHVLVRVGHATGEIMVVLVLSSPVMPSKNNFVKALRQLHPEITTIVVNVNDRDTSMVLGEREQVIYGRGYIEDRLCGMTFRLSPKSFYQINPAQTQKLYEKAMEYAELTGKETVLDAYCGTGTIGLIAAGKAKEVIGVELNRDAVRDAVSNAKRNGVSNIHFYQNDAGRLLLEMAEQSAKLDVLFMDPPRSGSDEAFLDAAAKIGPEKIIYISCSPETLVRDLEFLKKKGYKAKRCVAVDMFPYTESLEAVVMLSKKSGSSSGKGGERKR